jgi:hypothetical protein
MLRHDPLADNDEAPAPAHAGWTVGTKATADTVTASPVREILHSSGSPPSLLVPPLVQGPRVREFSQPHDPPRVLSSGGSFALTGDEACWIALSLKGSPKQDAAWGC